MWTLAITDSNLRPEGATIMRVECMGFQAFSQNLKRGVLKACTPLICLSFGAFFIIFSEDLASIGHMGALVAKSLWGFKTARGIRVEDKVTKQNFNSTITLPPPLTVFKDIVLINVLYGIFWTR